MPRTADLTARPVYRNFRLTADESAKLARAAVARSVAKGRPVTLTEVFREMLAQLPDAEPADVK